MTLKPGAPRVLDGKWVLDDDAVAGSMALEIEEQFKAVYEHVKGEEMSLDNEEDLRILLVAIARGVVMHLQENQAGINTATVSGHMHGVSLTVDPGDLP